MDSEQLIPHFQLEEISSAPVGNAERNTANILMRLEIFYTIVKLFRAKNGVNKLYKYPEPKLEADLYDYLDGLPEKQVSAAYLTADQLLNRYKLTSSWLIPITYVLLTDHLPLLPDVGIRLHLPQEALTGHIAKLSTILRRDLALKNNSILIEVTRNMKIEGIRDYLRDNKKVLDVALAKLPKRPGANIESRVLFWGHAAYMVRQDEPNSVDKGYKSTWDKRLKIINDILESSNGKPIPPLTGEELRLMYRSYIAVIPSTDSRE